MDEHLLEAAQQVTVTPEPALVAAPPPEDAPCAQLAGPDRRPTLWGAFAMALLGSPIATVIAWLLFVRLGAADPPQYLAPSARVGWLMSTLGAGRVVAFLLGTGVVCAALVLMAAQESPDWRERIAWRRPHCSGAEWVAVLIGLAGSALLGAGIATAMIGLGWARESTSPFFTRLDELSRSGSPAMLVLLVIAFGVGPALGEELVFRGFVLRALLARWKPWVAILVASAMFSASHIQLAHVLGTVPFAIWVSWLAWRTRSVLPGMVCHALNNSILAAVGVAEIRMHPFGSASSDTDHLPLALSLALLAVGAIVLAWAAQCFAALRPAPAAADAGLVEIQPDAAGVEQPV